MPPAVKNLLILNVLVFGVRYLMPQIGALLSEWAALWPFGIEGVPSNLPHFWPWQIVTSAFMHGGFSHILFNMFGLWMFGMRIENVFGTKRFLVYYLICVLGAGLAQLASLYITQQYVPTVGASGGVLGLVLAFGMLFPNERIYLYFAIPVPAKWFAVGYAAIDLFQGLSNTASGVAHFAHLGGMLAGLVLILYWRGQLPLKPRHRLSAYS